MRLHGGEQDEMGLVMEPCIHQHKGGWVNGFLGMNLKQSCHSSVWGMPYKMGSRVM